MPDASDSISRRSLLQAGTAASLAALPGWTAKAHAESADGAAIRVALVGCGGRGSGAVADAVEAGVVPIRLVAMADVFDWKLQTSHDALTAKFADRPEIVDVPPERRHVSFDGYKAAMDVLRPGDVVILATPLAFRPLHFAYAIERGLNVFMEKPVVADGPSGVRMLELAAQADAKNLKCAVGLMIRHCRARLELKDRIDNGEIGELIAMRAYRMHGPVASAFSLPKPPDKSETMYQIERFHSFLWASGGLYSDFYIHQIDETSWMKGMWPERAQALGGRHYRGDYVDQNFDTYAVEYTFPDGTKLFFDGRTMAGCRPSFTSVAHGTKGSAYVSKSGHGPRGVATFSGQRQVSGESTWRYRGAMQSPHVAEWVDYLQAIVDDEPYNEVPRGVTASLVTSMGRMAAHTGREITYEEMAGCPHRFAPNVDGLTPDGPAPLTADADGRYPVPEPGIVTEYEYLPQTPLAAAGDERPLDSPASDPAL